VESIVKVIVARSMCTRVYAGKKKGATLTMLLLPTKTPSSFSIFFPEKNKSMTSLLTWRS